MASEQENQNDLVGRASSRADSLAEPPRRGWGIFVLGFYKDVAPTALGKSQQNEVCPKPSIR
jgi:hypothetical protein